MIRGRFMTSNDDCSEIFALRRAVFSEELGLSERAARDEADQMAYYALVFDERGTPSGTGRLTLEDDRFVLGRVCVRAQARGQKLGDLVMRMLLVRAQEMSAPSVWALSRPEAVGFYRRYGLRPVGEPLLDEGVEKRWMRARAEEIDIEGACAKTAGCGPCEKDCASCDKA